MNNPRLTHVDRALLKAAIRRVFSRSELRLSVLKSAITTRIKDENRTRVKTWYVCFQCYKPFAGYEMQIDHVIPIVRVNETLQELDFNILVDRIWCDKDNLQAICLTCHKQKSKLENTERRRIKNEHSLQCKKKAKKTYAKSKTKRRTKRSTSYQRPQKGNYK